MRTFVVVPTFRETDKAGGFLSCFTKASGADLKLFICNGNPRDATTRLIREQNHPAVSELEGNACLYWSGLTNLGLRQALREGDDNDCVAIMNVDTEFEPDLFDKLEETAERIGYCQLGAMAYSGKRFISSGVQVRSWMLGVTRHPMAGNALENVPSDYQEAVHFLPTRCTLIPLRALRLGGLADERRLPHYGGDQELTNRLRLLGCQPYITGIARVHCDVSNTGNSSFCKSLSLRERISRMFSLKSMYNPIIRSRFIWMVFPFYARPSALVVYLGKSLVEVVCGGAVVRKLLPGSERGFSR